MFDTHDHRLQKYRFAVRLRFENGQPIVTAKGPGRSIGAHTGARDEAEVEIDRQEADDIVAGRLDPVAVLRRRTTDPDYFELWSGIDNARAGDSLQEVGRFENLRRALPVVLPSGLALEVEVDRTAFPDGRVDHEVEIEVPDESVVPEVEAWLASVAVATGVVIAPSTPKIRRFYASLTGAAT